MIFTIMSVRDSSFLVVIVGDIIDERLTQARSFGCETIDLIEERSQPSGDSVSSSAIDPWNQGFFPPPASILSQTAAKQAT